MATLLFDPELIRRYDCHGPRYTSYPTAVQFHTGFDEAAYRQAARESDGNDARRPISLYVHIPFCASPCFYCACNRIITRSTDKAQAYLARLHREIEMQAELFSAARAVRQLHFGGGTPTFLTQSQLAALLAQLGQRFSLTDCADREYSIEIDPRTVTRESIRFLAQLGFNRVSFGVQDLDPAVQLAVNRIQSIEQTLGVIDAARSAGIGSISVDLIYGLPKQTRAGFARTLQSVLAARPDRLAVYAYAHLPKVFKAQRRLRAQDLPSSEARLELLGLTIETLTGAGYEYVGMDHFALPDDELVLAKRHRTLHRNFQGYATRAHCDLVGLGVSAIGSIGATYAQNFKSLPDYSAAVDQRRLPIQRGIKLTRDDIVRRAVIQELMCHEHVDFAQMSRELGIDFERYFEAELGKLRLLARDGLVELTAGAVSVTGAGKLLMRNLAMTFDAHLQGQATAPVYSRAI